MLRVELARWRNGAEGREQLGGAERSRMAQMGIEGRQQRRALLDDAYAGVGVSMNAPFVSFGATKPALQVQIVARKIVGPLDEQAAREALHDARHGGVEARGGSPEAEGDRVEV